MSRQVAGVILATAPALKQTVAGELGFIGQRFQLQRLTSSSWRSRERRQSLQEATGGALPAHAGLRSALAKFTEGTFSLALVRRLAAAEADAPLACRSSCRLKQVGARRRAPCRPAH